MEGIEACEKEGENDKEKHKESIYLLILRYYNTKRTDI